MRKILLPLVALIGLGGVASWAANYALTEGAGKTFGSIVVSAVNYAQQLLCDPATPTQCAAVDASGILSVKSTTLATAANQATANTSLATIATNTGAAIPAGTALIGKVGIDQTTPGTTNGVQVNAALPAGTNLIGKTGIDQTTPGSTNGVMPSITNAVWGTTSAMTGTTSTSLIAGTSSKVTYVTSLSCVNSHATVGTFVTIQDGSGGTTLGTVAAAAVFGGTVLTAGGVPLFPGTTSGNGVFVADVTTGANVICTAAGFHT